MANDPGKDSARRARARVRERVLMHRGANTASQAISGAALTLTSGAVALNESGGANAGSVNLFTAPAAGRVVVNATLSLPTNKDAANTGIFRLLVGGVPYDVALSEIGNQIAPYSLHMAGVGVIASGANVTFDVQGVAGTTTTSISYFFWQVQYQRSVP